MVDALVVNQNIQSCPHCEQLIIIEKDSSLSKVTDLKKEIKFKNERLRLTNRRSFFYSNFNEQKGDRCPKCLEWGSLIILEHEGQYTREGSTTGPDIMKYGWHPSEWFLCANCGEIVSFSSMLEVSLGEGRYKEIQKQFY